MTPLLKATQTLILSPISNIFTRITQRKPKVQDIKWLIFPVIALICLSASLTKLPLNAYAISDPLSVPNNKFGIHLIDAVTEESSPAAGLVNSSGGDWGYITVIIEAKDRSLDKWQSFFNDLRRRHLIPLIRIATSPKDGYWQIPGEEEAKNWADFFDYLNWPTKNRYIIVYNEPNHAQEWGNTVDAGSYAVILEKFILTLKSRNSDYFILNAGFDASSPQKPPQYEDEVRYLTEMNKEVPGIFDELDGWVSHSYPNPGFTGSPYSVGRGTINNWQWELSTLQGLGLKKSLPVFITETGWEHAEGLSPDNNLPSSDTVAGYFKYAFENVWTDPRIVAVTPFLLTYDQAPFDHFSWKIPTGEKHYSDVLGISTPNPYPMYYSIYQTVANLAKNKGQPVQIESAQLTSDGMYPSIVAGQNYHLKLNFKNTGESIWGDQGELKLLVLQGQTDLGIQVENIGSNIRIEPGQSYQFSLTLKAPNTGTFTTKLALYDGANLVDTGNLTYQTAVKSPVIVQIEALLRWRNDSSGDYFLSVSSNSSDYLREITLDKSGVSSQLQMLELLPDYNFDFTLERPYYQKKTIHQSVSSGLNSLNFGELQPDFFSAIFHPKELWKLLPFSN